MPRNSSRLLLAATLVAATSASAAALTWTGNTDTDWATGANWAGTAPASGDSLVFGVAGTSGTTLTDTLTGLSLAGITFNSGASAYTMGGNAFTLAGNITNSSTALQTVNQAITLGSATTVTTTAGGGDITLGGAIDGGAFALNKAGAGTLSFTGAVTNLGAVTTDNTAGNAIAITSTGSVTMASLNGGSALAKVNMTSAGNLTVSGAFIINNNTSAAAAAAFTQTAGAVNLTSSDTGAFTNGVVIAARAGATTQNAYNLQGGTLNVLNTNLYTAVGGGANGLLNITGGTANLLGLTLSGTSSSAVGALSLTGGRLNLGANGLNNGATTSAGSTVTLGAGTVGAFANWSSSKAMILSNAATGVTFNTTDSVDSVTGRNIALSGVLSSTGKLNLTGAGKLTLSGANTYAGGTAISGGTLNAANNTTGQFALGTGNVSVAGGTLAINDTAVGQLTLGTGATLAMTSGKLNIDITGASTYDKIVGNGTAHFTLTGGTLLLSGFGGFEGTGGVGNTYSGLFSGFAATGNSTSGLIIAGYDQGNWTASLDATNGTLSFTATAVPEPSTYGLLGAGALAAVALVRRRRVR